MATVRSRLRGRLAAAVRIGAIVLFTSSAAAPGSQTDDYPYTTTGALDPWNMVTRECTSYVAYELHQHYHTEVPAHWHNAGEWAAQAALDGVLVDATPTVGSVAQWESSDDHPSGHVAMVTAVHDDGSISIADYNWTGGPSTFGTRDIQLGQREWPSHFIHAGADA